MNDDRLPALAQEVSRLHPDDPLPADIRGALCEILGAVRDSLTGPAAVAVDVLLADEDSRAGEALVVLHDVRRSLHTEGNAQTPT